MRVMHQGHAGQRCRQAAHQRGARAVGVDDRVAPAANELHQTAHRPKIPPRAHRHVVQDGEERRIARLAHRVEGARLEAGEADAIPQLGQTLGQQVLHPFRARVVFPVDDVEHADGGRGLGVRHTQRPGCRHFAGARRTHGRFLLDRRRSILDHGVAVRFNGHRGG